jgi:hypothetical protein
MFTVRCNYDAPGRAERYLPALSVETARAGGSWPFWVDNPERGMISDGNLRGTKTIGGGYEDSGLPPDDTR